MQLSQIIIQNIRTHKHFVFTPAQKGITTISGENGAGKSTIVDAFAWGLFGTRANSIKNKNFIRDGVDPKQEPVQVTIDFTIGNKNYRLIRKILNTGGQVECNIYSKNDNQDEYTHETGPSVTHAEAYIRNLLQCDEKGFLSSVFIQQKQVDALINASSKERGQVIEKLIGVSSITEATNLAKEESRSLQKAANIIQPGSLDDEKTKVDNQVALVKQLQEQYDSSTKELASLIEEFNVLQEKYKQERLLQDTHQSLEQQLALVKSNIKLIQENLTESLEMISNNKEEHKAVPLEMIENEYLNAKNELSQIESTLLKNNHILSQLKTLFKDKYDEEQILKQKEDLSLEQSSLEKNIQQVEQEQAEITVRAKQTCQYIKLLEKGEGTCNVCGQSIHNPEEELKKQKDLQVELKESLTSKKEHMSDLRVKTTQLQDSMYKIDEVVNIIQQQKSNIKQYKQLEKEQKNLEVDYKTKQKAFNILNNKYIEAQALAKNQELLDRTMKQIEKNQKMLKKNNKEKVKIEESLLQSKAIPKSEFNKLTTQVENLNTLIQKKQIAKAKLESDLHFSKENGKILLQAYKRCQLANQEYEKLTQKLNVMNLTNKALTQFKEKRIKTSIPELTAIASEILFKFTNGDFTELILTESFDTFVKTSKGIVRPVQQLSGGELSAASIALRLAIALFLSNKNQSLLILDEVLTAMSTTRSQLILETIASFTNSQIILIAHNDNINSFADKVVTL